MSDKENRFWSKVQKTEFCWHWTASKTKGYGFFYLDGRSLRAHRVSWKWLRGEIPAGLVIDHMCRNRSCVNPDHLRVVTNKENILCGEAKAAKNKRKTHCIHGHPLIGENLRHPRHRPESRICRTCERNSRRAWTKRHIEKDPDWHKRRCREWRLKNKASRAPTTEKVNEG